MVSKKWHSTYHTVIIYYTCQWYIWNEGYFILCRASPSTSSLSHMEGRWRLLSPWSSPRWVDCFVSLTAECYFPFPSGPCELTLFFGMKAFQYVRWWMSRQKYATVKWFASNGMNKPWQWVIEKYFPAEFRRKWDWLTVISSSIVSLVCKYSMDVKPEKPAIYYDQPMTITAN